MTINWEEQEGTYADAIAMAEYHRLRLEFIASLMPDVKGSKVLDFGCGEGVLMDKAIAEGASEVIGIDPSLDLVMKARNREAVDRFQLLVGNVELLTRVSDETIDLLLCANVMAYLTDSEECRFYAEAKRILKPGGNLLITHSNVLFDMFTFNNLTVDFFIQHFGTDITPLLADLDSVAKVQTYSIRENPLLYGEKLLALGFVQEQIRFFHRHMAPPLLNGQHGIRDRVIAEVERESVRHERPRWTEYFNCSTFGVRATRM